jgi:hypothetical protein
VGGGIKKEWDQVPWLTPVTLATQEAEIRRIAIQASPRQIEKPCISKNTHYKRGLVEGLKW